MKTLTEIISNLRKKDYIHDFTAADNKIISSDTNETFEPEDLVIEKVYRYEGDSNPDDMSVVYGINSPGGTKGVLIDAYGTYADPDVAEIIKRIPLKEIEEP